MYPGLLEASLRRLLDSLYAQEEAPPTYLSGAVPRHELEILLMLYFKERPRSSVEWGLGSGIVAVAIAEVRRSLGLRDEHIALDPFQEEISGGWGLRCLERFSARDMICYKPITSHQFLIESKINKNCYDFIFVDGAHDIFSKTMDALLASEVLAPGGLIVFHDGLFFSTRTAVSLLLDMGFVPERIDVEPKVRRYLRSAKYIRSLGARYAIQVIPNINYSLVALRHVRLAD